MSSLLHGMLAGALVAVATLVSRFDKAPDPISASVAQLPHRAGQADERFRLSAAGGSSCIVTRFAAKTGEPARLAADDGCNAVMPGLSKLRLWQEASDGSVMLSDVRGTVLATFAAADGAGYESFEPLRPLMALMQDE